MSDISSEALALGLGANPPPAPANQPAAAETAPAAAPAAPAPLPAGQGAQVDLSA